jgi:putative oxidoreductase
MDKLKRWAILPLRIIVGYGFMAHAWGKLARGPELFIATLHGLGVPAPALLGYATIAVELVGGLLVLIGAFLPVVSVPLAAVLLVALFSVHLPFGFSAVKLQAVTEAGPQFGKPGMEVALFYLVGLATLVMGGPGPLAWRARR